MAKHNVVARQTASFTRVDYGAEHQAKVNFDLEQCTRGENGFNSKVAAYHSNLIALLDVAEEEIARLEHGSRQLLGLASAIVRHDSSIRGVVSWVGCAPSGPFVEELFQQHQSYVAELVPRAKAAVARLFSDFTSAVDDLTEVAQEIGALRGMFETTESPPSTVEVQFQVLNGRFLQQDQECSTYTLVPIAIKDRSWDPAALMTRASVARAAAAQFGAITDLDHLRFEYAESAIRCPLPRIFSSGAHSTYFSNSELNGGSYQWAILPAEMLAILDGLHDKVVADLGYPLEIGSCYVNPRRVRERGLNPKSEHQYGKAVDLQTGDFNSDGLIDSKDWQLLRLVVESAGPTSVESIEDSGVDHVHAEWTQVAVPG